MHSYHIVVNGNEYAVTVKSINGDFATVDVDGWEFDVRISNGEISPNFAPPVRPVESNPVKPVGQISHPAEKKKRESVFDSKAGSKSASTVSGPGVLSAQIPGLILEINVKVGEEVKKGQMVLKMEAMKMVNEVKAHHDGTVKEILVKEQQNVLENEALMVIE
ncbi:MAG: biotin/lipoyl-containing protein [bacterium]